MVYHICNGSIYISQFYSFSRDFVIHQDIEKQFIFLNKNNLGLKGDDVKYLSFIQLLKLFVSLKKNDRVILHSYNHPLLYICCFICSFKLSQFAWVIWGGDLFFYREYRTSLKFRIYEYLRRRTIKRFGYFLNNEKDYLLAQEIYSTKGIYFSAGYPQLNLKEDIVSHTGEINILLGNSADPSNNHIEALKLLSKFSKERINIYVPLSYGGTSEYIETVIECGRYYFGNQFIPLLDVLSYEKYLEFLDSIAIMINNHDRQQALGNIGYLLSTGAKIFIKSRATSFSELKDSGFVIFDTQALDEIDFGKLVQMNDVDKMANSTLIHSLSSSVAMAKRWRQAFEMMLK